MLEPIKQHGTAALLLQSILLLLLTVLLILLPYGNHLLPNFFWYLFSLECFSLILLVAVDILQCSNKHYHHQVHLPDAKQAPLRLPTPQRMIFWPLALPFSVIGYLLSPWAYLLCLIRLLKLPAQFTTSGNKAPIPPGHCPLNFS